MHDSLCSIFPNFSRLKLIKSSQFISLALCFVYFCFDFVSSELQMVQVAGLYGRLKGIPAVLNMFGCSTWT